MSKKVFIKTFGCQMNEYDSDKMLDVLHAAEGYEPTDSADEADLILFKGLRLDALGGVDQQDRALAGLQGTGHLIAEVDLPGGVDQMQHVIFGGLTCCDTPRQPNVL